MKFVGKTAKLTLFSRKINQDILRENNLKHNQQQEKPADVRISR